MIRLVSALPALVLLTCCATAPSYNPTVFPFEIDRELLSSAPLQRVVIASVSLGGPTRSYLQGAEQRIDEEVADYLRAHAFQVVPQRRFQQEWKRAVRVYGNPVDPTSGRVNQKTFTLVLVSVRDALLENDAVDAIVFTDVIEKDIAFSGGLQHTARWDGVARKPSLQGPGQGVSTAFDWNQSAKGTSLWINVYNMDLQRVFSSMGGLDATEAIDTRSSSGAFVRRRNILENEKFITEGVELAFHPLIEMGNYPGNQ